MRGESIKGREVTSGLWEASCLEKSIKPTLTLTHTRTTRVIFYCQSVFADIKQSQEAALIHLKETADCAVCMSSGTDQ